MRLRDILKTIRYDLKKKTVNDKYTLKKSEEEVQRDWNVSITEKKSSKALFFLLIAAAIFFFVSLLIALYINLSGFDRVVSSSKINIITQGPSIIESGENVNLEINIANRNPVAINGAVLTVKYPEGSYSTGDRTEVLITKDFQIGQIDSGDIKETQISLNVIGSQNEEKVLEYIFEYLSEGATSKIAVKEVYELVVKSPPVSIGEITTTSEVSGKETTITIPIKSNSKEVVRNIFVTTKYPSGFSIIGSDPKAINLREGVWGFSSISPGATKYINIKGILSGESDEEKSLIASALVSPVNSLSSATEVSKGNHIFNVSKSFVDLSINFLSIEEQLIASPGQPITGFINWENISNSKLEDFIIFLDLKGSGLDVSSIDSDNGRFDEINQRLVWDKNQIEYFNLIGAKEKGKVKFKFNVLPNRVEFSAPYKKIDLTTSAGAIVTNKGRREQSLIADKKEILVRSAVSVTAHTLYLTSMLVNSGPVPPEVGKQTTYALKFFIQNSGNDLRDVKLVIPLTISAEFTGNVSGLSDHEYEYNEDTRVFNIDIGSLPPDNSNRSIEIQVRLTPVQTQRGDIPNLTNGGKFTSTDNFVGEKIEKNLNPLKTLLPTEPFSFGEGSVK